MVPGYYTLQEAAQFLAMNPDQLKQLAQKKEIRSFQDRGTLRFRVQDVQELGRRLGTTTSEPDLVLREPLPPSSKVGPKSGPSTPRTPKQAEPKSKSGPRTPTQKSSPPPDDIFEFSLDIDDRIDIGKEILSGGSKKSGPSGRRSPPPKAGSDSDVRLVGAPEPQRSDSDVKLFGQDSDVKMLNPTAKTPKVAPKTPPGSKSPTPRKSGAVLQPDSGLKRASSVTGMAKPADSGVRLVPMDSDSDVKIVGAGSDEVSLGESSLPSASDSDIRLERRAHSLQESGEGESPLTEEINLDEEIRRQEAALKQPAPKLKRKSQLKLPPSGPFELAESDSDRPVSAGPKTPAKSKRESKSGAKPKSGSPADSSDLDLTPADSSDFDLSPAGDGSVLLTPDASDDFSLELPDESALGGEPANLSGPSSGISLHNPVDAGISLEEGSASTDMDFDLSLEVETTPKPAKPSGDSDSEFELSLDGVDAAMQSAKADSDSEFELTLDDSGNLATEEEGASTPAPRLKAESEEKDIFETDFEVPALDEDSGSQVAPLDTDLDSSDFDIALDDAGVEDESASQVVALDEEADEAATTRADEDDSAEVQVDEGFGDLESSVEEEEGAVQVEEALDERRTVVKERVMEPAPWGALPVVFMLPCVIVMVLVGILGFEIVQSAGGYKTPGVLTKAVSELIGKPIK